MRKIKIMTLLMSLVLMFGVCLSSGRNFENVFDRNSQTELTDLNSDLTKGSKNSQVIDELHSEVLDYVSKVSTKTTKQEQSLIATTIVSQALEHNIDICFILAQGTLETHLGTTGIGKSRKSIFGVGKTYESYDQCITRYVKLIHNHYLGSHRTVDDLLNNYSTIKGGHRYSESDDYEMKLKSVYKRVIRTTNIKNLQDLV